MIDISSPAYLKKKIKMREINKRNKRNKMQNQISQNAYVR